MANQNAAPLILVVDDDKIIRALMRRVLKEDNCDIAEAKDGKEGLLAFEKLNPDLVLLDAMMPEMDGFEACRQIKSLPQGALTPVLIITGLQDSKSVDRAFEVGATDFITKPVHWTVLRHRVRRLLRARQAEEDLRQSEAHYRNLFEDSPISVWEEDFSQVKKYLDYLQTEKGINDFQDYFDKNPEDIGYCASLVRIINVNNAAVSMFDATSKQDLIKNLSQIFTKESYPQFRDQLVALFRGETVYEAETVNRTLSGRKIDVILKCSVAPSSEEDLSNLRFSIIDVTERKKAEQALRENEARFRNVVTSISDHIYVTEITPDGQFKNCYASPGIEKLVGYPLQEILEDWTFWSDTLIHPDDLTRAAQQAKQLRTVTHSEVEYRMVRADGEIIWVRDSVRVGIEGDCRVVYGVVSDISERKRSEEILMASQKLADLGTLAAGVAHEINSPLQVITGVSKSLQNRLDQDRLSTDFLERKLDVIHRNGWRCAEIVRSLKTYAHASSMQIGPNDLNEIIKDTLLLIEHQLKSWSNITVITHLASNLPVMYCDRNQISQIIINLLTNARDAMPEGGKITISTDYNMTSQEFLLEIADTGSGIPEAVRSKIFDPFFTTKAIGMGTGLGLSIIAGMVQVHGGEIGVQSSPLGGTSFLIKFPNSPELMAGTHLNAPDGGGRFNDSFNVVSSRVDKTGALQNNKTGEIL